MQPDGSTCIRVVFGSGGVALGWSTENMTSPESEMKAHVLSIVNGNTCTHACMHLA